MKPLNKIETLMDFRKTVKTNSQKRVCTNCFLSNDEVEDLIFNGKIEYEEFDGCILVKCTYPRFNSLYYYTHDLNLVPIAVNALKDSLSENTILEDLSRNMQPTIALPHVLTLEYFQRANDESKMLLTNNYTNVIRASEIDLPKVEQLLLNNFNPTFERVPDIDELKWLLSNDGIYLYINEAGDILGLIIFEIIGNKQHLRYWLTLAEARGMGVGSALMLKFFEKGEDTKLQYLWVVSDNENAKRIYAHYGFQSGKRYDHIFEIN